MTVTATTPVNRSQLVAQLTTATNVAGILAVQGDPTRAGAVLWSSQWSDGEIETALAAITYQPPSASVQQQAASQVQALYDSLPGHLLQAQTDAATIAAMTPGTPPTAEQITALSNHANGWITLLEALQILTQATGLVS